jgi:hypothetical protein
MACSQDILHKQRGLIDAAMLISALRTHHPEDKAGSFAGSSIRSVCMHGGGLIGDHTTGSYVASLGPDGCTYWATGSSTPCLAAFKPLWLDLAGQILKREQDTAAALEFWYKREELHRAVMDGRFPHPHKYLERREQLEQSWLREASGLASGDRNAREQLMERAWREEDLLVDETMKQAAAGRNPTKKPARGLLYRSYWRLQTKNLSREKLNPRIFNADHEKRKEI